MAASGATASIMRDRGTSLCERQAPGDEQRRQADRAAQPAQDAAVSDRRLSADRGGRGGGGRFHAALTTGALRYKLGFDAYRLRQAATQTITDRHTGQIHHDRHPVWPDAYLADVSGYAQVIYGPGAHSFGGTVRIDREQSRVGGVTEFFAENAVPAYALHAAHGRFPLQTPRHDGHGMGGHGAGHQGAGPTTLVPAEHLRQNNLNFSAAANASLRLTNSGGSRWAPDGQSAARQSWSATPTDSLP